MREWASAMHCTVAERGLWATSALTLMMPALRNEMNVARQITRTSAHIPVRRFARNAGFKGRQRTAFSSTTDEFAEHVRMIGLSAVYGSRLAV
jgi:hypothetical protein